MTIPSHLSVGDFKGYPPLAKKVASENVVLFQEMPTSFLALLLKELINWDWKFPAERDELDRQLEYLRGLSKEQRSNIFAAFAKLRLSSQLEQLDWVNAPSQFSEQLSTHLWATNQIDAFRVAAVDFFDKATSAKPEQPPVIPRLGVAVIGQGVEKNKYPLFRKLRPQGTYFQQVKADDGVKALLNAVESRAKAHPISFGHFYIDGGINERISSEAVTCLSYGGLTPARAALQEKMRKTFESGTGPEAFRSMLARMRPEDLGISSERDPVLSRFEISILTEGAGTQIFSTTFVQWAAREALRRAQPLTIMIRFTPRQRERPMNELLSETQSKPSLDPHGSLIDGDMGTYYTWLNQQRLAGANRSSFLAWFENGSEAVAVGPGFTRGAVSSSAVTLDEILRRIA